MPELPEVQTVLDTLRLKIQGLKILKIDVLYAPIIEGDLRRFKKKLINQTFNDFKRRGKYLLFEMDDCTLVSHLRMEGKYFIVDDKTPISKHDHIIFHLSNKQQLRYNDVRKFGRMSIIDKDDEYLDFNNLGVEPFSKQFNVRYCLDYTKDKKIAIKQLLLDQHFIAGIGNIYADEILYAIGIHPSSLANKLSNDDYSNLVKETRRILKKAIKAGGTTIRSYTSSLGVTGRFQMNLKVHTMKKCPKCHSDIVKTRVATRGTYYCPKCQKIKK